MNHPKPSKSSYLARWARLSAIVPMLVAPLLLMPVDQVLAAQYLNCQSEPQFHSNADGTVLMCDDFEDGAWYYFSGQNDYDAVNKGWKGEFGTWPDPQGQNYGRCLPNVGGAAGTNCSAESLNDGGGQGNQARHKFNAGAVNEIYLRFYLRMAPGYNPNHHKLFSIGWSDAFIGEQHIIIDLRYFQTPMSGVGCVMPAGASFEGGQFDWNNCWLHQNLGNDITFTTGKWYYIEYHLKLNTPGQSNGVYEMWADDCGANGLGCTGPGTLRTRYTGGAGFREQGQIEVILFEAWQNTGFTGSRYWDQVVVRTQRVGPRGVMQPPTKLQVQ